MSEANKGDPSDRVSGTCPQNQFVPGITRFNEEQQESGGAHGQWVFFADSGSRMPPNADLYASPCEDTPSYVKHWPVSKYLPKLIVLPVINIRGGTCPVAKTTWVTKNSLTTAWGALAAICRGPMPWQRRVAVIRPCQRSLYDPRPHHTHARPCASWRRQACL